MTDTEEIDFAEAVRIVEKAGTPRGRIEMSTEDWLKLSACQAILATEYVRIKHLIMPA